MGTLFAQVHMHLSSPRRRRTACVALAALQFVVATTVHAQRSVTAAVDSVMADVAGGFSGHILAVSDGRTVFERSYGMADRTAGRRFTAGTGFSIASVTKQFTRVAVLKLEQDGRLALTDTVGRFLPSLPADKRALTLRQLIDMSAGLHEYHDRDGDTIPADLQSMSKAEALQRIGAQALLFAPGSRRQYSNSGYTLLAAVVEAASGKAFSDYVRETILVPLGLRHTGFFGEKLWPEGVARPPGPDRFRGNAPEDWPTPQWSNIGSGGMISTAGDLSRFIQGLRAGRILNTTQLAKHYSRPEFAFYAGGSSFGLETDVMEFDDGKTFIIYHSNSGMGHLQRAAAVAAAVRGRPNPEGLLAIIGPNIERQAGPGPGGPGPGTPSQEPKAVTARALLAALRTGTVQGYTEFIDARFTPALRASQDMSQHLALMAELRTLQQASMQLNLVPVGEFGVDINFRSGSGMTVARLTVSPSAQDRVESLRIVRP